jgi:hypothetical protein
MLTAKRAVPVAVTSSDSTMKAMTTRISPMMVGHPIRLWGRCMSFPLLFARWGTAPNGLRLFAPFARVGLAPHEQQEHADWSVNRPTKCGRVRPSGVGESPGSIARAKAPSHDTVQPSQRVVRPVRPPVCSALRLVPCVERFSFELARHAEAKIVTAAARPHFAPSFVSVLFGRMPTSSAV